MKRLITTLLGVGLLAGAVDAESKPATGPAAAQPEITLADLQGMFRNLDQDNDGKVTRKEHATFWQNAFKSQDKDNSGALTRDEVDPLPRMRGAFDGMDADKDGKATPAEHDAFRRGHFKVFDKDKSGDLTMEEYTANHPDASSAGDR